MAINYKVEVDIKEAEKQLNELSTKFEDAFNAGRSFDGTNYQVKKLISDTSTYLRQLKKEYQDTVAELERRGLDPGTNKGLAKLKDDIKAVESELEGLRENWKERRLSSENIFQGISQGAQGLMGAFTAAQGAAAMLGAEEEKLQKIQTKLQASMSILMGLQRAGNLLNSTSQFRVQVLNKLQEQWYRMNLKVAASEGIKKAAMSGGVLAIGALISVITALLVNFSKYREEVEKTRKLQKTFRDEFASSATSEVSTLLKMQALWKNTNGEVEKQRQFIAENRSELDAIGVAEKNISDVEKSLFSTEVKDRIIAKAKATAYLAQMNSLVAESMALQAQMEDTQSRTPSKFGYYAYSFAARMSGQTPKGWDEYVSDTIDNENSKLIGEQKKIEDKITEAWNQYEKEMAGLLNPAGNRDWKHQQAEQSSAIAQSHRTLIETITRNKREELRTVQDLENQIADARIAAMKDGFAKEDEVRKEANRRELESIKRAKEDYVEAAKNRAKAEFDATEAVKKAKDKDYVAKVFDPSSVVVDTSKFDELLRATEAKQYADNLRRILDDNSDFVREFNKMWEDFSGKSQELLLASFDLSPEEFERAQNKLLKMQEDKMAQFARNLAESYEDEDFTNWYKAIQNKNYRELEAELAAAEERFFALAGAEGRSEEEMVRLQAEMSLLKRMLRDFSENEQKDVTDGFRDWSNAIQLTHDIFESAADSLGGMAGEIAKSIGNTLTQIQSVGNSLQVLNNESSNPTDKLAAKMNLASTAISGMIQLVGMYVNSLEEAKKAEEEWQQTLRESEHRMAMLRLAELDYQKSNIFGVENPYSKAIAGAKQYAAAIGELNDMQAIWNEGQIQTGTKKAIDWKNVLSGAGTGAAAGAALGSIIPGVTTVIGAAVGGLVGAVTGLFSRKVEPVFESLASHYGRLFDDNYKLNQQLVADYDKLDDATKQIVDNWDEIVEKMKEAEEQMRENFHDLAGDLGDSLSNKLVEAFRNGKVTDAMKAFKGDVTEILEGILQQQVFSTLFSDLYDTLEQEMMSSFKLGGDQNLVDDIMRFDSAWQDRIGAYGDAMKQIQDYYKTQGYDLWSADKSRTAASKALTGVTQDSFNEMSGRVTSIQLMMNSVYELTQALREQQTNLLAVTASILYEVQGIHQDTERMQVSLDTMQGELTLVRSGVNTITDKGVRMLN